MYLKDGLLFFAIDYCSVLSLPALKLVSFLTALFFSLFLYGFHISHKLSYVGMTPFKLELCNLVKLLKDIR